MRVSEGRLIPEIPNIRQRLPHYTKAGGLVEEFWSRIFQGGLVEEIWARRFQGRLVKEVLSQLFQTCVSISIIILKREIRNMRQRLPHYTKEGGLVKEFWYWRI